MKTRRKRHSAEFKAKVALEAIKAQKTINEVAARYQVHPNLVTQWKKLALESLPNVFSDPNRRADKQREQLEAALYQQISQLKV